MDYVVKTEVFEGPFDLLLHLIARQRVDIWQVSLSRITEDYLAEVRRMRELNLEVATEFLVVAATLLELKAARLLPAPDADPDEIEAVLEERDLLFARVLQYRAYKQAAGLFGARLAEQTAYVPRRVGAEDLLRRIVPELLVGVSPEELARLAAAALTPAPPPRSAPPTSPRPGCRSPKRSPPSPAASRTGAPAASRTWSAARPSPSRSSSACLPSWSCTSDRWSSSTRRRPSATSPSAGPAATWPTPST